MHGRPGGGTLRYTDPKVIMEEKLRIVFFGTPEFAVASLDMLVKSGYNVVGIVTTPDKPAGRGLEIKRSAVKEYANSKNLRVVQPENLKSGEFISQLKELSPNLGIVVAFRKLPREVWSLPKLGTFNLHGSLLPHYRGAAPINWAIINGEKESGDRKSTRLNSSHSDRSRMPSSA